MWHNLLFDHTMMALKCSLELLPHFDSDGVVGIPEVLISQIPRFANWIE